MELPYDDNDMYYDEFREQYVLKKDFVLNNIYLDEGVEELLRTNERMSKLFIEVSDDVYRYIYRNSRRSEVANKKYLLTYEEGLRKIIKLAMLYQIRYYLRSGGGALKDQHGVDVAKSKVAEINRLRGEGMMSPHTLDVLTEGEWNLLGLGRVNLWT